MTFQDNLKKLEEIKETGKVILLKMDGERESNQYVATIGFPEDNSKVLSYQGGSLEKVVDQLVHAYKKDFEL